MDRRDPGFRDPPGPPPPHAPQRPTRRAPAAPGPSPPPPLAIAQVIGRFEGGGAEHLAYNLAAGLASLPQRDSQPRAARSYAVALRTARHPPPAAAARIDCTYLGATPRRPWTLLAAALRLRRFVRSRAIDIVHIHGRSTLLFCAVALMALPRPPRLVFTWHDSGRVLAGRRAAVAALRWAIRRCDRVYGPSGHVAALLTQRARLPRPAAVFRNGVAPTPPPAPRGPEPVIAWAARMTPEKDPHILLRAAARLRAEGRRFRLILAGSAHPSLAWYEDETRRLVRDLALEDIVSMPGWVEDIAGLFAAAHIGVQTSHKEGLSLALLEQMMAGLAIIATDVGDTAAAIRDGQTGILIQPGDEDDLTDALRRVLDHPPLRDAMGRCARELAQREFTLDRIAERAAADYARLAAPEQSPGGHRHAVFG